MQLQKPVGCSKVSDKIPFNNDKPIPKILNIAT